MDGKGKKEEMMEYKMGFEGILKFRDWIVVLRNEELRREILEEAHRSKYTVHLDSNKM